MQEDRKQNKNYKKFISPQRDFKIPYSSFNITIKSYFLVSEYDPLQSHTCYTIVKNLSPLIYSKQLLIFFFIILFKQN